jgi:hypothetical protein
MVYFSTIQGLLSRLFDVRIKWGYFKLVGFRFTYRNKTHLLDTQIKRRLRERHALFQTELYVNPKLEIYYATNRKLTPKRPVYMFDTYFPADVSFDTVELLEIDRVNDETIIDASGVVLNSWHPDADSQYGAYEFEYKNKYVRYLKKEGMMYFFPQSYSIEAKRLKEERGSNNFYVEIANDYKLVNVARPNDYFSTAFEVQNSDDIES